MKYNGLIKAAIPGVIAIAAIALSLSSPVNADTLIGYGSVFALLGVAALDYRVRWKRVLGR